MPVQANQAPSQTFWGGLKSGITGATDSSQITDPTLANYTIAGMPQYQQNMGDAANRALWSSGLNQQVNAANLLGQTAAGHGPSLAAQNLQNGLGTIGAQIQAQSMANQGNIGAGVAQRNALNAYAGAANNAMQQARTASVAEQLGAMGQYAGASQALTAGQLSANNQYMQALNNQLNANNVQTNHNIAYDQVAMQQQAIRAGANAAALHGLVTTGADLVAAGATGGMSAIAKGAGQIAQQQYGMPAS